MDGRFSRLELLVGEKGLSRLAGAKVMVCGLGGVGGACALALARSGVGTLVLADDDRVVLSNFNRQAIADSSTLGLLKTEAAAQMIGRINPDARVVGLSQRLTPENVSQLVPADADYVIDCIDDTPAKIALALHCQEAGIPLIASMGTARKWHPEMLEFSDISKTSVCPLCKSMRHRLKEAGVTRQMVLYSKEQPAPQPTGEGIPLGSTSVVPPVAGQMLASYVLRALLGIG